MTGDRSRKETEGGDPVASLFMRAKQAISSPLYLALRDNPTWTADSLRQWATGRRRPRSMKLRAVATDLRARAASLNDLADEFDEMADMVHRGQVPPRPGKPRGKKGNQDT